MVLGERFKMLLETKQLFHDLWIYYFSGGSSLVTSEFTKNIQVLRPQL